MKCCVSTRQMSEHGRTETFKLDPDYSTDAGTGLLSPISYKHWYAEFNVGKIRHLRIGRCTDAWFYSGFIHREPSKQLCRRYMCSTECPSSFNSDNLSNSLSGPGAKTTTEFYSLYDRYRYFRSIVGIRRQLICAHIGSKYAIRNT